MVYSEKLVNIIALMKCEDHHTKKLISVLPYNCLYLNKGNKGSILTKLVGYQESIVLIICTRNELNLANRYWDMNPDGRTEWTDRRTDNAKTISFRLRQGIIRICRYYICVMVSWTLPTILQTQSSYLITTTLVYINTLTYQCDLYELCEEIERFI